MLKNIYRLIYLVFVKKILDIFGRLFYSHYYIHTFENLRLVSSLNKYGYASYEHFNFDANYESNQLFHSALRNSYKIYDQNRGNLSSGSKLYLRNLLVDLSITEARDIINFFTSNELLSIASSYLECIPFLTEIKLLYSPSINCNHPLSGSQLFHKDFDDSKNLKVFINLTNITLDDGPLQIFDKECSQSISNNIKKYLSRMPSHSDEVEKLATKSIISLIGPLGTVNFIDSCCCYHRGSRNPSKYRLVLYATYNSRTSYRFPPYHWLGFKAASSLFRCPLQNFNLPANFYSIITQN